MNLATIVDLVLAVVMIETIALLLFGRHLASLPPIGALLPNLAAGLFLVLALRAAVHDQGSARIAGCLALAGIAHVLDLRSRAVSRG